MDILKFMAHGYRKSKLKFAIETMRIVRENPLFPFQLGVFFFHPSWFSFALIFIGLLCSHLLMNDIVMWRWGMLKRNVMRGALDKGFTGQTVLVSSALAACFDDGDFIYRDVDYWLVRMAGTKKTSLDEAIHLHIGKNMNCAVCYSAGQFTYVATHIFLNGIPKKEESTRKFLLLHELFHSISPSETPQTMANGRNYLFFGVWVIPMLAWNGHTAILSLLLVCVFCFIYADSQQKRKFSYLLSELLADEMAVGYLSAEDAKKVRISKYLKDGNIGELFNSLRLAQLRRLLDERAAGQEGAMLASRQFEEQMRHDGPLLILATIAICILPAAYAEAPGWPQVWVGLAWLGVLLLLFLFNGIFYGGFTGVLRSRLDEAFPMAERAGDAKPMTANLPTDA